MMAPASTCRTPAVIRPRINLSLISLPSTLLVCSPALGPRSTILKQRGVGQLESEVEGRQEKGSKQATHLTALPNLPPTCSEIPNKTWSWISISRPGVVGVR